MAENVPPALDEKTTVPVGTVGGAEPESVTVTPHEVLVSGVIELGLHVNETETELGGVTAEVVEVVDVVDVEVVVLVWAEIAVVVEVIWLDEVVVVRAEEVVVWLVVVEEAVVVCLVVA